jgi:uncharacterized protein YhaN
VDGAVLDRMMTEVAEQEELARKRARLKEHAAEYEKQMDSLQTKIGRYRRECGALMEQAGVADEEAFRAKGKARVESVALTERLNAAAAKIEALVPNEAEREAVISDLSGNEDEDREITRLEEEAVRLSAEERALYAESAEKEERRKQLEEGGTYAELMHEFAAQKAEFLGEARKWAVERAAVHLLKKTKERYRSRRLPRVVERAEHYFQLLTDGEHEKIFLLEKEGFVVQRHDGKRFSPNQLSRGTAEQLYLALRLALAETYQSPSPYPLIMDDILVNFDHKRTENGIKAFREASRQHQILFFTCHRHMLGHFKKEEKVSLTGGESSVLAR